MDLLDVQAELFAREPIFHKPELGTGDEGSAAQTADDLWEVGASRQVYLRDDVLDRLTRRRPVPSDDDRIVSDVRYRELGDGAFAITCRSIKPVD